MSGVPREDIFITAKDLSIEGVTTEQALRKSLKNLGVEYVDLYLIHNAMFAKNDADLQRKWAEMEAVKELGLARSIGVSNLERQKIEAILKTAKTPPAINQIELHPYFQRTELVSWLQQQNIALACYSPLAPLRSGRPGPVDEIFQTLAKKYKVDESEIGLRWAIDQGRVVITTSSKEERVQGYGKKLPSFKLTAEEISDIAELGKKKEFSGFWRYFAPSGGDK
ncbi:Aldo/keto reductase [Beauveria brongniartii RCEF 3172]|uniref:Aldo/keto reductase n=1 Tax=Beauveria brongniartii RCEF 3172 TaxID=1081107 RepID=A0A166X7P0_9HYPO|nr:Aldo/keto reductase [Beauveria brongniartii RCEF 3172]